MRHPNSYYGSPAQTEAEKLPLNIWTETSQVDTRGIYGDDQKAFESAYFHNGMIVGNIVVGLPYMSGREPLVNFGLTLHSRRIADVSAIRAKAQAKRAARQAKAAAAKSIEDVISLTFDKNWDVVEKITERRTVYSSSVRKFIKTRSNGSPTVHEYKGKFYVVYGVNLRGRTVYQKVWNDGLVALLDKHG